MPAKGYLVAIILKGKHMSTATSPNLTPRYLLLASMMLIVLSLSGMLGATPTLIAQVGGGLAGIVAVIWIVAARRAQA
jgi:membrane associated rhomboid family serine protease